MGVLLILAQIALVVLNYAAHVTHLSPWIVFLPAMAFAALWLVGRLCGCIFVIDSFTSIYRR